MKKFTQKRVLFFSILFTGGTSMYAQFPNLTNYVVNSNAGVKSFDYPCEFYELECKKHQDNVNTEIPPWIIGGGWRTYFLTNGSNSYVVSSPDDLVSHNNLNIKNYGTGPFQTSSPQGGCSNPIAVNADLILNGFTTGFNKATNTITMKDGFVALATNGDFTASIVNGLLAGQDWRRSYYNIYSAHLINHPAEGNISLGILHAENKAKCDDNGMCHSTVNPFKPSYDENPTNGQLLYQCPLNADYWPTMGKFVCAKWIHNNESTNWGQQYFDHDMGPITWPSNGYALPSGQKASSGTSEPSSIVWNGYVYVFYVDHGPGTFHNDPPVPREEGRHEGIKVIRAPIGEALNPSAYRAYYKDPNGVVHWNPSLPAGFNKDHMDVFWNKKGPQSTDLMGDETGQDRYESHRFTVAHVVNSNPSYFIGVESYIDRTDNNRWKTALRFSYDMLSWTDRQLIIEDVENWNYIRLGYPVFLDFEGWSNTEVDINSFFVMGKGPHIDNKVNLYHIYRPGARKAVTQPATAVKTNNGATGILPTPNHGIFRFNYTLSTNATVQINVLDVTGRQVYNITPGAKKPGHHVQDINISAEANGVYMLELVTNGDRRIFKTVKN